MRNKQPGVVAYLVLLVLSLPAPLLHHCQTARVIESLRPAMRLDDGSYVPMLMPITILWLRWLGELSWLVAFGVLVLFVMSFWRDSVRRCSTVCVVAICQCAFTTFYALYAVMLFGYEWLHRTS